MLWVIGAEPGSEVLTHNAPAAIVNAMRRYPQQASLQTVACAAFRAIAEQPGAEVRLHSGPSTSSPLALVLRHAPW